LVGGIADIGHSLLVGALGITNTGIGIGTLLHWYIGGYSWL